MSLALLVLASCGHFSLVAPERTTIGDALSVEPAIAWNRFNSSLLRGPTEVWTVDGDTLHLLSFFVAVADGESLFRPSDVPEGELPVFRAGMTPVGIADFLAASMTKATGSSVFEITEIRPESFAGMDGFRIGFSFATHDEVDRSGLAAGAVHDGHLYLILYHGTRLYHFGRYKDEVDHIIQSAQLATVS